jgi:post-segregation antitoxin (ccd killing protein)
MTTVQLNLNLPDTLAQAARQAGLLTSDAIERLLEEAVRRRAIDEYFEAADRLAAADLPPMSLEEIQAEVDAVRTERKGQGQP